MNIYSIDKGIFFFLTHIIKLIFSKIILEVIKVLNSLAKLQIATYLFLIQIVIYLNPIFLIKIYGQFLNK